MRRTYAQYLMEEPSIAFLMRTNVLEVREKISRRKRINNMHSRSIPKLLVASRLSRAYKTNDYLNKQTNNRKQTKVLIRTTDSLNLHLLFYSIKSQY